MLPERGIHAEPFKNPKNMPNTLWAMHYANLCRGKILGCNFIPNKGIQEKESFKYFYVWMMGGEHECKFKNVHRKNERKNRNK